MTENEPMLPEEPIKPPFAASAKERIAALLILPISFLYTYFLTESETAIYLTIFAVLFVALTEYLYAGTPRPGESWFWLACLAVILLGYCTGRNRVWDEELVCLFAHLCAVYWAVCRAGKLTAGKSSRYVLPDALNAFLFVPFRNFFLQIRCIFSWFTVKKGEKPNTVAVCSVMLCILVAVLLLTLAVQQLSGADNVFAGWVEALKLDLSFDLDAQTGVRLTMMFPVAFFVFGLLAGLGRKSRDSLDAAAEKFSGAVSRMHQVPNGLWSVILLVFCAVYAAFFVLQGQYLFGAFRRQLPEGFTVAQYARQGFFELCKVMVINLVLYWVATRTGKGAASRLQNALIYVLLAESMLFAVVALSKLGLYISCFGFTPLRLQSCWLAVSMLFGCGCTVFSHRTGTATVSLWMFFSAATLSLLHLF